MKFIHAADVHIDSPMRGLEKYEGAPVEELRTAPRRSFENIVTLAIETPVDFVIIAGDLFDGPWQDMQTGIWTASQFHRLDQAGIPVFLLQGNHDAESRVPQAITWPNNVKRFATDLPSSFEVDEHNVVLHGQGFAGREAPDDLVPNYPAAVSNKFNIGVLHTSLTGDACHDRYAPTNEASLAAKGYDYWALGHIHIRRVVQEKPLIVFSGNCQGRNIHEAGAKGCYLVSCEAGSSPRLDFHATDQVRWHVAEVRLDAEDGREELLRKTNDALRQIEAESDGRLAVARVVLTGASQAYSLLTTIAGREEMTGEICNLANAFGGQIWIEKVKVELSPLIHLDELRKSNDLLGELLRKIDHIRYDEESLQSLSEPLAELEQKAAVELSDAGIELRDHESLLDWLAAAEMMLANRLGSTEA